MACWRRKALTLSEAVRQRLAMTCQPTQHEGLTELGRHRVRCLVTARDGGRGHMYPITRCSGGDGLTASWTNAPGCDGRLTLVGWTAGHRTPRVKAIGGKTVA